MPLHTSTAHRDNSISENRSIESRGQTCILSQRVVGWGNGRQTAGPGDLGIVNRRHPDAFFSQLGPGGFIQSALAGVRESVCRRSRDGGRAR